MQYKVDHLCINCNCIDKRVLIFMKTEMKRGKTNQLSFEQYEIFCEYLLSMLMRNYGKKPMLFLFFFLFFLWF